MRQPIDSSHAQTHPEAEGVGFMLTFVLGLGLQGGSHGRHRFMFIFVVADESVQRMEVAAVVLKIDIRC